jgi:hypothetical protein
VRLEFAIVGADGVRRVVSATATPLHDERGAFDGAVAVFSDITIGQRRSRR